MRPRIDTRPTGGGASGNSLRLRPAAVQPATTTGAGAGTSTSGVTTSAGTGTGGSQPQGTFDVSLADTSLDTELMDETSVDVTITPMQGFTGTVTLSVSGLPNDVDATIDDATPTVVVWEQHELGPTSEAVRSRADDTTWICADDADDPEGYEALVKAGEIKQAPAGTDADYFILTFARELDASVLSNDRFKDRISHFPDVKHRIIRYMIVAGEVVLERRTKRRAR